MLEHNNLNKQDENKKIAMPARDDSYIETSRSTLEKVFIGAQSEEANKTFEEEKSLERLQMGMEIREQKRNVETPEKRMQNLKELFDNIDRDKLSDKNIKVADVNRLLSNYNYEFVDKLSENQRKADKKDRNSELYKKERNATHLKTSEFIYSKYCHKALDDILGDKKMVSDQTEEYRDVSQFMYDSENALTSEEKRQLLNGYIGVKNTASNKIEVPDRMHSLDLCTKVIMSIDVSKIKLDSDLAVYNNAAKLESISGKIAAYERMVNKYNKIQGENNETKYLAGMGEEYSGLVKEQVKKLRLIALYYIGRKNVLTNEYYLDRKNSELSDEAPQNANERQKKFADAVAASLKAREDLVNYRKGEMVQSQGYQILTKNLDQLGHLNDNVMKSNTANASKCDLSFKNLFIYFNMLKANSRSFNMNSHRMKAVKDRIKDLTKLFSQPASEFTMDRKPEIMHVLSELNRACREYCEPIDDKQEKTLRQKSVFKLRDFSSTCLNVISSMTEKQFNKVFAESRDKTVETALKESDMLVEVNSEERLKSEKELFRMQHYQLFTQKARDFYDVSSDFYGYHILKRDLDTFMEAPVTSDLIFDKAKQKIAEQYDRIIELCKRYTTDNSPYFDSAIKRNDFAKEILAHSFNVKKVLDNLQYPDVKDKKISNIRMSDLIFGERIVVIHEDTFTFSGYGKNIFKNKPEDQEQYKLSKAIGMISGDNTMFPDYRRAEYTNANGELVKGFVVTDAVNRLSSHGDEVFKFYSHENLVKEALNAGQNIRYSENALRQLSVLRIMDALMGRKQRDPKTILYNASSQQVFGESTIIIQSILTQDFNYFADEDNKEKDGKIAILDENDRLNIGAYDRKVANNIMGMTAQQCLDRFADLKINMTENDKKAFVIRFNRIKNAFVADMVKEDGWRYKTEKLYQEIADDNEESITNTLKKYRRWKLGPKSSRLRNAKMQLKMIKDTKLEDKDRMYTDDMKDRQKKGLDMGLVDTSLLKSKSFVEADAKLEDVEIEMQNKLAAAQQEKDKLRITREYEARKKIIKFRDYKSKYKSNSDNIRLKKKKRFVSVAEQWLNKDTINDYSEEFKQIATQLKAYGEMDVVGIKCEFVEQEGEKILRVDPSENYAEGLALNELFNLTKTRMEAIDKLGEAKTEMDQKEYDRLKKLYDELDKNKDGKLELREGVDPIVFKDEQFVSIVINRVTNEIEKKTKIEMNDKKELPLFAHEPCANDIFQGNVGDCYFLGFLASIAEQRPNFIREMIKDNNDGTVTVRFFKESKPVYITVSKSVPKNKISGGDNYVTGALWVQMIEKAYVASGLYKYMMEQSEDGQNVEYKDRYDVIDKLKESNEVAYGTISSGRSDNVALIITGKKGEFTGFNANVEYDTQIGKANLTEKGSSEQEEFINKVKGMRHNKSYSITVSSLSGHKEGESTGLSDGKHIKHGISSEHAYTVMGVDKIGNQEIIILRNPWGIGSTENYYNKNTGAVSMKLDENNEPGAYLFLPREFFFSMFKGYSVMPLL